MKFFNKELSIRFLNHLLYVSPELVNFMSDGNLNILGCEVFDFNNTLPTDSVYEVYFTITSSPIKGLMRKEFKYNCRGELLSEIFTFKDVSPELIQALENSVKSFVFSRVFESPVVRLN